MNIKKKLACAFACFIVSLAAGMAGRYTANLSVLAMFLSVQILLSLSGWGILIYTVIREVKKWK